MGLESAIVDSREPEWIRNLTFGGIPVMSMALECGDLICQCDDGATLVIERKTVSDFLGSITDGRLFSQAGSLYAVSQWAYLIICGELRPTHNGMTIVDGRETGWQWASIQGAFITVQELGVHLVFSPSDYDFEATVIRLGGRNREHVPVMPVRDALLVSEQEIALAALPGIGPERAKAILDYCGSVAWSLTFLTDDDPSADKLRGIGPETKKRIRRLFDLPDDQLLHVIGKAGYLAEKRQKMEVVSA